MNNHLLKSRTTTIALSTSSVSSSLIILTFLFFQISCESDSVLADYCADPLGSDNKTYVNGNVFCFKESFNGCFTLEFSTTKTLIRAVNFTGKELAMIVDIGPVKCLSEVNTKPIAGYVYTANAVLGHGYVIKLPDGTYGRFYVDSWIKSNTTAVAEINITRQYSF